LAVFGLLQAYDRWYVIYILDIRY